MAKRGAPIKIDFQSKQVLEIVEELAGYGYTEQNIADYFGICGETLRRNKKKYLSLCEVIKKGKEKKIAEMAKKLVAKAMDGDTTALIFFLKNRAPDRWGSDLRIHGKIQAEVGISDVSKDQLNELFGKALEYIDKYKK